MLAESLQARAVVLPRFTTAKRAILSPSCSNSLARIPTASLAVNESRSYERHMFPPLRCCFFSFSFSCLFSVCVFFCFQRPALLRLRFVHSVPADVPNPRVKCNLTVLLRARNAAARGSPLNARYFRIYVIFMPLAFLPSVAPLESTVYNRWTAQRENCYRPAKYR